MNAQYRVVGVFISDDESGLHHDYGVWLERLAPHVLVSWVCQARWDAY
jgi:hypothetical protein